MATIIRLTKLKGNESIRVNFDNVIFYLAKGDNTVISFLAPKYYEHTLTVRESVEEVDRLLG